MREVINASEAARLIGCNPQAMRFNLKKGIWTFGDVIPPSKTGKKEMRYNVRVRAMCREFGIPIDEIRERMEDMEA